MKPHQIRQRTAKAKPGQVEFTRVGLDPELRDRLLKWRLAHVENRSVPSESGAIRALLDIALTAEGL